MKEQFPIFKNNKNLIYLDSAATAQKPQKVLDAMNEFYTTFNANVHRGLYPLSDKSTQMYEEARAKAANFLNADIDEIVFTSGTTEGINNIARSLKESGLINQESSILLTEQEHHSNIVPWQMLGAKRIEYIPLNDKLGLDLESINNSEFDVVSVSLASNVTGNVVDIKRIRKIFPDAYLVVDAAQAAPHIKIDVKALDVDFLIFSGHKLYGPTGIGILYAKKSILEKMKPFNTGGGMIERVGRDETTFDNIPHKFEAGTPNIAGAVGLGAAIDFLQELGFQKIVEHETKLKKYLLEKLSEIKDLKIIHSNEQESIGLVSFTYKDIHSHDIAQFLGDRNICIRAGHHCTQILHKDVLSTPSTARLSLGIYNEENDINLFIEGLKEAIRYFSR